METKIGRVIRTAIILVAVAIAIVLISPPTTIINVILGFGAIFLALFLLLGK